MYLAWPSEEGLLEWHLLGYISNEKPSAMFRLAGKPNHLGDAALAMATQFGASVAAMDASYGATLDPVSGAPLGVVAQIGVSIEPLAELMQQTAAKVPVTR